MNLNIVSRLIPSKLPKVKFWTLMTDKKENTIPYHLEIVSNSVLS